MELVKKKISLFSKSYKTILFYTSQISPMYRYIQSMHTRASRESNSVTVTFQAHVLGEVNNGQSKNKQHTFTKPNQTEKQVLQRSFKEALILDNEESDNEE